MAIKNVAVLLGDPRKFDLVKPDHGFDDDDIDTINKLKEALQELKNYSFTYLDSHDTFIKDLQKNSDKIDLVFNLCDEGFYNDLKIDLFNQHTYFLLRRKVREINDISKRF